MHAKKILQIGLEILLKSALKRVGFWSGTLHDFAVDGQNNKLLSPSLSFSFKWLIVVGREYYLETVRDYPIGNSSDLKKIIKNEQWAFPYKGKRLTKIERLGNQSHRVTSWVIKQSVIDSFSHRPIWLLPESACVERLAKNSVVSLERLGETLYVLETPEGIVSSLGHKSAFYRNIGISEGTHGRDGDPGGIEKESRLAGADAVEATFRGAISALKNSPLCFLLGRNQDAMLVFPWLAAVKLSIAICLSYLLLISSYIMASNSWLDSRLQAMRADGGIAIELRKSIEDQREYVEKLGTNFRDTVPFWTVFELFLDLRKEGVQFRVIISSGSELLFYIDAARASEVVSRLSSDPRVAKVDYYETVRQVNALQQFAIKLALNPSAGEGYLAEDATRQAVDDG